ncbi:MAG: hypothetical protein K2G53_06040 [Muribaculaceae bacterium]|nr:hypothetical protein [Muribaculaceae bacterium]
MEKKKNHTFIAVSRQEIEQMENNVDELFSVLTSRCTSLEQIFQCTAILAAKSLVSYTNLLDDKAPEDAEPIEDIKERYTILLSSWIDVLMSLNTPQQKPEV